MKNPVAETTERLKIEYLFSVSFPLVGSPQRLVRTQADSPRRAGARILPTCSEAQERFWTSQNDRNMDLRQKPQGVIVMRF